MKTIVLLLCSTVLTGCAATNSWLGVGSGAELNSNISATNGWNYKTTTVITPQGSFLVNSAGSTVSVIRTAK